MTKEEVAQALEEIADLLELQGENAFRCKAYREGARAIRGIQIDLWEAVEGNTLAAVRGIGEAISAKVATLVRTGHLPYLEELRKKVPSGLLDLRRVPGLGPRRIKAIYDALKIDNLTLLRQACESNQIAQLPGFGAKTQQKILEGIPIAEQATQRVRLDLALPLGLALLDRVRQLPGVQRAELCGSLRRRRETAKDIDILVSSDAPAPIMHAFIHLPEVVRVTANGETKSSIVASLLVDEQRVTLNADLRVVRDAEFPFALHYFTGSKEHNIRMRQRANERGWTLNEYGLTDGTTSISARDEAELFAALGMEFIPPELREDTGEIEAAAEKKLPILLRPEQIRGVFHNHTVWSDGTSSVLELARTARRLGWEYLGIGDHSRSLTVANGMSVEQVREQWAEIDALNRHWSDFRIFKGIECDILEDGSLDYDDDLLAQFDYVVASVHSHFQQSAEQMTRRICRALRHPSVTMLGHATGRLILRREGYKVDLDAVLKTAAEYGKMIEINANPMRLDLDWQHCKKAKALGIPLVINPDAHSPGELEYYRWGVDVARRGWLEAGDVFNTLPLGEVCERLAQCRRR